nr:hypothetical protein [Tanacetum cinerariifolium]
MTIDQQVALDDALVPHASRLRIGKSNFHLRSYIMSKESTLQVVYDVLRLTPFLKAFWSQQMKSTRYDNLRLSQAQILWGMYHKKNVDFTYLLWEEFVYQVEHKDVKKSNEMYFTRFTKFGAMLPVELTNKDIRNSVAYKEYYAIASGVAPPKTKASVRKTQSSSDTTMPPPTAANEQDDDDQDDNDDDQDLDNNSDDFVHPKLSIHDEEDKDEESFDPIVQTPSKVENFDDESHGMNVGGDERPDAEDDDEELYRDININLEVTTTVVPLLVTSPTLPPPSIPIISQVQQALDPTLATAPNTSLQDLLNFSSLFGLRDKAQAENDDFLNKLDENIQKIIKEQVKDQVKTYYVVVADLSELELKKNHSDTYGDIVTFKRRRDDEDKDEEPTAGSVRGSKRRREGKGIESTSAPKEKASKTSSKSTKGSKYHQKTASESAPAEEPMQTTQDLEEPSHQEFKTCVANDQPIAEAFQHFEWESAEDVYSKRRIIVVTEHQIVEWHNCKHLDWITIR